MKTIYERKNSQAINNKAIISFVSQELVDGNCDLAKTLAESTDHRGRNNCFEKPFIDVMKGLFR